VANVIKENFLNELKNRFGNIRKLDETLSLYDIGNGAGLVYIRYSKIHSRGQAFYGLRQKDLQRLEGHPAVICFLWENQTEPLILPYADFEEVFHSLSPASDGQYKVQVFFLGAGYDLYIANAGRFNVEAYFGWEQFDSIITKSKLIDIPDLTHIQVQTMLGSIGSAKGFDIWIPKSDRGKLDWNLTYRFGCDAEIPFEYRSIDEILSEIDVMWIERGAGRLRALFEVEHSTPIYSGLLRFNDVHLMSPNAKATYSIVSNDDRRTSYIKQLNRPTFVMSKLSENCTFIEYPNVFTWHKRVVKKL
jgi:hypothetical protein